jgi:hypothetical protein
LKTHWTRLAIVGLLAVALVVLWGTPYVWPLRILVVMFHELGHAVTTWVTGGSVESITLSPDEGGLTRSLTAHPILVLNGGYLGSLLAGVGLVFAGSGPRVARWTAYGLGGVLVLTTLLFVRPIFGFAFPFCVIVAGGFFALGRLAPGGWIRAAVAFLGVFSVAYAMLDIWSDVFLAPADATTDATMLRAATGIPAMVWGLVWMVAGAGVLWLLRRPLWRAMVE